MLFEKGQYEQAIFQFNDALKKNQEDTLAYYYRGLSHFYQDKFDLAKPDFDRVISMNMKDFNAHYFRGMCNVVSGAYNDAILDLNLFIDNDKSNHYAFFYRGQSYLNLDQTDKGIDDMIKTIELDSTFAEAYFILGKTNIEAGQFDDGIEDVSKAAELGFEDAITLLKEVQPKKLFNDLLKLTQNLNQFEGTAFVGSLDGPCYMVLTSNSQGDNIAKLRYQINNYYQGKADKVDETYTVTELKRKSAKIDGFGLNNTRDYEDIYLYGSVKGLKASINDGAITDGSGSGNIWFVLDSVDYELTYVMASSVNWSFQGSIKLEVEQYIKLKELFTNKKLSENEVKVISKSRDLLELNSNDSNFVSLGNNQYKVLISKKALVANWRKNKVDPYYNDGFSWYAETKIQNLFSLNIKNISSKNIGKISIDQLYTLMNKSGNADKVYWFMEGSTLWDFETLNFDQENEVKFDFDLVFSCSRLKSERGLEHLFNEKTMEEVLQDADFQKVWTKANLRPAITNFKIYDNDRQEWQDVPLEIYFELVD